MISIELNTLECTKISRYDVYELPMTAWFCVSNQRVSVADQIRLNQGVGRGEGCANDQYSTTINRFLDIFGCDYKQAKLNMKKVWNLWILRYDGSVFGKQGTPKKSTRQYSMSFYRVKACNNQPVWLDPTMEEGVKVIPLDGVWLSSLLSTDNHSELSWSLHPSVVHRILN